jgi:carbonic anhydrase
MRSPRLFSATALVLLCVTACEQRAPSITPEVSGVSRNVEPGTGRLAESNKSNTQPDQTVPQYPVPLARDASPGEPLALARAFVKQALVDNKAYMTHGSNFFSAFVDGERPRATVVTCSDSRVQAQAWDETSENDDYIVRNFGNQIAGSEGSLEYGIEHLHTPLLLIIGHTGCDAVKAASGERSRLSKSLRAELKSLRIPRQAPGKSEYQAWADGVIANVHHQVASALGRYGKRVRSGELTVVGAVFDLRGDLGQGSGKLLIVDVNGNTETERIAAFEDTANDQPEVTASPAATADQEPKPAERDQRAASEGRAAPHGSASTHPR